MGQCAPNGRRVGHPTMGDYAGTRFAYVGGALGVLQEAAAMGEGESLERCKKQRQQSRFAIVSRACMLAGVATTTERLNIRYGIRAAAVQRNNVIGFQFSRSPAAQATIAKPFSQRFPLSSGVIALRALLASVIAHRAAGAIFGVLLLVSALVGADFVTFRLVALLIIGLAARVQIGVSLNISTPVPNHLVPVLLGIGAINYAQSRFIRLKVFTVIGALTESAINVWAALLRWGKRIDWQILIALRAVLHGIIKGHQNFLSGVMPAGVCSTAPVSYCLNYSTDLRCLQSFSALGGGKWLR